MNNNWMINPPNLFGMRTANRNYNQNAVQPSSDFICETNTGIPEHSQYTDSIQPEEYYNSSCYCEYGTLLVIVYPR